MDIILTIVAVLTAVIVGYYLGKNDGKQEARNEARDYVRANLGCQVEAHVRLGKDDKYGIQIGAFKRPFDPDFITSLGDRKREPGECVDLVRKYFPNAKIVEGVAPDHPNAAKHLDRVIQGADFRWMDDA